MRSAGCPTQRSLLVSSSNIAAAYVNEQQLAEIYIIRITKQAQGVFNEKNTSVGVHGVSSVRSVVRDDGGERIAEGAQLGAR